MGAQNNENNPQLITLYLGTLSTVGDYAMCSLPKKLRLLSADLINQAVLAADATNYCTVTLKADAASLGVVDTDADEGNVSLAANTPADFGVTEQTLDADTVLKVTYAEGGSGTLTAAVVQVWGYWL